LFNIVGQVSHALSGVLGSEDEEFYNSKISKLEKRAINFGKVGTGANDTAQIDSEIF
jgi:hypothetical protein